MISIIFDNLKKLIEKPWWNFAGFSIGLFMFFGFTGGGLINNLMNYEWIVSATKWSLIVGAFIFSLSAYYRPRVRNDKLDGSVPVDTGSTILREIALGVAEPDIAKWTLDGTRFSAVPVEDLWKQWFHSKWIMSDFEKGLDDFNFGDRYYLLDLINREIIKIPTGIAIREKKVSDIIKPGMVLMLRKYK